MNHDHIIETAAADVRNGVARILGHQDAADLDATAFLDGAELDTDTLAPAANYLAVIVGEAYAGLCALVGTPSARIVAGMAMAAATEDGDA